MNEKRYWQLIHKRGEMGLSSDEADELGRLMAERQGEAYSNASNPPPEVTSERRLSRERPEFSPDS
jgi:hypothetical protein